MAKDTAFYRVLILDSELNIDTSLNEVIKNKTIQRNVSHVLVANSPQQISPLWQSISDGIFEHLVVSGDRRYVIHDGLNYCKRLRNLPLVVHHIQNQDELKNVVNLEGNNHQGVRTVMTDVTKLRQLPDSILLSFVRFQAAAEGSEIPSLPESFLTETCFFQTAKGIERLGGLAHVKNVNWAMGDLAFNRFSAHCLLDFVAKPVINKQESLVIWPAWVKSTDSHSVLFDLSPASEHPLIFNADSASNVKPAIRLPRQILTGRVVSSHIALANSEDSQAVFVMSSYNKEDFIAAAIWSIAQQTYDNVALQIMDDKSCDTSMLQIKQCLHDFPDMVNWLTFSQSESPKGTYGIRNAIISQSASNSIYLVNDADDISSAIRASLQINQLQNQDVCTNIGNIVRLNANFNLLSFDDHVEHYGSASLASTVQIHKTLGYYQMLRKGTDTEFINRVQHFLGKNAFHWSHYPVLYQTFGKSNLTDDIYQVEQKKLVEKISNRQALLQNFTSFHAQVCIDELPDLLPANCPVLPVDYASLPDDFFIEKANVKWIELLYPVLDMTSEELASADTSGWNQALSNKSDQISFKLDSRLDKESHHYLYLQKSISAQDLVTSPDLAIYVYFETLGDLGISAVLVYQDAKGEQISHQFFWANHKMPVKMPAACESIKLGFRLQGAGSVEVKRICFTTLQKPE